MSEDAELLQRFVEDDCQDAFRQLVDRYIDVVFAAARRQVRDVGMAQDVTQAVFMILAKKASAVSGERRLTGWLLQVTRFAANNALRERSRRQHHEQRAAEMKQTTDADSANSDQTWDELSPLLDEGISKLKENDRGVLLAKFFERRSTRELADNLGISEAAAEKRVTRAVDKLRDFFRRRGVVVSAAALASGLLAGSAHAAPSGLSIAVATTATTAAANATSAASIAKGTVIAMAYAKTKAAVIATVVGVLLVGGATVVTVKAIKSSAQARTVNGTKAPSPSGAASAKANTEVEPFFAPEVYAASKWPITFSDGSKAEVLAITNQPGTPNQWWAVDGSPLPAPNPQPRNILYLQDANGAQLYQFAVQQSGDDLTDTYLDISMLKDSSGSANVESGGTTKHIINHVFCATRELNTTDLRFSFAHGPWTAEEVYDFSSDSSEPVGPKNATLKFISVHEEKKLTVIRISNARPNLPSNRQETIRVRTADGQEKGHQGSSGGLLYTDYSFAVAQAQIAAVVFRYRPMETRDLRNVSLISSVKSQPSVIPAVSKN